MKFRSDRTASKESDALNFLTEFKLCGHVFCCLPRTICKLTFKVNVCEVALLNVTDVVVKGFALVDSGEGSEWSLIGFSLLDDEKFREGYCSLLLHVDGLFHVLLILNGTEVLVDVRVPTHVQPFKQRHELEGLCILEFNVNPQFSLAALLGLDCLQLGLNLLEIHVLVVCVGSNPEEYFERVVTIVAKHLQVVLLVNDDVGEVAVELGNAARFACQEREMLFVFKNPHRNSVIRCFFAEVKQRVVS